MGAGGSGGETIHEHNTTVINKVPSVQVSIQVPEQSVKEDPFLADKLKSKIEGSLDKTVYHPMAPSTYDYGTYAPYDMDSKTKWNFCNKPGQDIDYDRLHKAEESKKKWMEETKAMPWPRMDTVNDSMFAIMPFMVSDVCKRPKTVPAELVESNSECRRCENGLIANAI